MKIVYRNSMEDLVFVCRYYLDHSPDMKRLKRVVLVFLPLLFLVLIGFSYSIEQNIDDLILWLIALALYLLLMYRYFKHTLYKKMKKRMENQNTNGILCEHTLQVDEEYLSESTEWNETKLKLEHIHKIEISEAYTLIFLNSIHAIVIPKNQIIEGDYSSFVERLNSLFSKENK